MAKTYFVSGYENLTEEEFCKYYEEKIFQAINEDACFIVGDFGETDIMSQKYLKSMMVTNVVVYYIGEEPRKNIGYNDVGGFLSREDRDAAMTRNSNEDITYIQPDDITSYVYKNIQRRKIKNS